MASPEHVNKKPVSSDKKNDKPDFSGFLRAINVDRLNPANNPEKPLLLRQQINSRPDKVMNVRLLQATGVLVSAIWLAGAAVYVQRMVGWSNVSGLMPHEMGGFLAGILTPIALFWMIAAFILRSNDVKMYAEALREEIQGMIFPSDEANRRVNNDIERLMRQTAEMSKATRIALSAIETAREGLKNQVNLMNDGSAETVERLSTLGSSLNARMQDAATMGAQLEATLAKIEKSADAANEKLGTSRDHLESSAKQIDQSTQSTEDAVARLSQLLRDRLEALGSLHQETEAALQNAASEIALQRVELRTDAESLEQQAYAVGDALQKGADKLYNFTDDALDKAKLIETKLLAQTESLQNVLANAADNATAIHDATSGAVDKLGNATTNLSDESTRIEDVLQQAVTRLEDRALLNVQTVKDGMDQTTARLGDDLAKYADQAVGKITTVQTQIEQSTHNVVKELDDVANRATDSVDAIQNEVELAVQRLIEEMAAVEGRTTDALGNINLTVEQAAQKLGDNIDAIGQRATDNLLSVQTTIDQATQKLGENVDVIGQRAADNLRNVQTAIDEAAQKTGETIDTIGQRTTTTIRSAQDAINDATQKLGDNVDTIGERATQNIRVVQTTIEQAANALNDNMANVAIRATDTVKNAQEQMEQAANRLMTDVDAVGQRAKSMTEGMLSEVGRKVSDTTAAFAYIQTQIQSLVGLFDQRKLQLDETGTSARQTAEAMQTTLQNALDKVQQTANALQSGIGAIQVSVTEPIKLLENAATMAHQRAGDISQILGSQTETMLATTKQLGTDVEAAQQQLHSKNQDIALLAGKIASHLKTVGQELETQNAALDGRLNKSVHTMETLYDTQKKVAQNLDKIQEQTAQTTEQTETSTKEIQQKIDLLQQLHKALATDAATSKGELDRVSDRLITISTTTVDKIKNSIENMTLLEADYHRLSDAGIDSIEALSEGYRDTLANVRKDTQETVDTFVTIQAGLEEKALEANRAMEAQLANLQATAGDIGQTIGKVHEFGDTIALHTSRINDIGQRFDVDNEKISIHVKSVHDAVSQIKDYTIEAVDSFMQQGQNLEQQMQTHVTRMNDVNQNFVYSSDTAKNLLAQTVEDTENLAQKIQGQIGKIRQESQTAETTLSQLVDKLGSANQNFATQRNELEESGGEILNRLQLATQQLGSKASELEKAAQAAQQQAEELRAQERKLNEESFFNSTKFIVESLHSLALDFTRMLEGELNEKTWRGYQKGDVGSFTRRLLSTRDEETQNKIRNKFKEDVEFRTYVQRYLRQFEEIYDSAEKNDHAHLLTSIFITSDVGKLYQFVCTILDREPRGTTAK